MQAYFVHNFSAFWTMLMVLPSNQKLDKQLRTALQVSRRWRYWTLMCTMAMAHRRASAL